MDQKFEQILATGGLVYTDGTNYFYRINSGEKKVLYDKSDKEIYMTKDFKEFVAYLKDHNLRVIDPMDYNLKKKLGMNEDADKSEDIIRLYDKYNQTKDCDEIAIGYIEAGYTADDVQGAIDKLNIDLNSEYQSWMEETIGELEKVKVAMESELVENKGIELLPTFENFVSGGIVGEKCVLVFDGEPHVFGKIIELIDKTDENPYFWEYKILVEETQKEIVRRRFKFAVISDIVSAYDSLREFFDGTMMDFDEDANTISISLEDGRVLSNIPANHIQGIKKISQLFESFELTDSEAEEVANELTGLLGTIGDNRVSKREIIETLHKDFNIVVTEDQLDNIIISMEQKGMDVKGKIKPDDSFQQQQPTVMNENIGATIQDLKKGDKFLFNDTEYVVRRKWINDDNPLIASDGWNEEHRFYHEGLEIVKVNESDADLKTYEITFRSNFGHIAPATISAAISSIRKVDKKTKEVKPRGKYIAYIQSSLLGKEINQALTDFIQNYDHLSFECVSKKL